MYDIYLEDITIAENKLKEMKLYPEQVMAEFYCIPSHNHQAYYALLSPDGKGYKLTYVKILIYQTSYERPIRMYTFSDCRKAEESLWMQGQFVMGISLVPECFCQKLLGIFPVLPKEYIAREDGLWIDGIFQYIRSYSEGVERKVAYMDASRIGGLTKEQSDFLENLYLDIEALIDK